jgi:cell division protein FtsI (penicillin-binding protein 3)
MEIKKDIMWRIYLVFACFLLFGIAILVQIFRIQFVQGDYWRSRADSLSTQIRSIEASRGNIFSSDGSLLATSVPIYDVRMDLKADGLTNETFDKNIDSLSLCLASLFQDKSRAEYNHELRAARNEGSRYYLIQKNVHYTDLQKLKRFPLFRLGKYKGGLVVEQRNIRELPFKELAQRTIGTLRDIKPVGIEAAFDGNLQGASGSRLMQRIAGGVWMPLNDKEEVEPKDGNDIITTIDVNIQDVAESALERHLRKNNADHGCVAVMEVATGNIVAIANLSKTSSDTYEENFNYVIAEATEPGSTMKLASLLAGIDDGLIDLNEVIDVGNGYMTYCGQQMRDAHAPRKPKLTVKEAFMTSSNVGISKIITRYYSKHQQDFLDKLTSFGLNSKLGLQIEGEGRPRIKNSKDKDWNPCVSLPWTSIGYEVLISPMQTLTFYNAIANNGRMVKPKFVKEIRYHGQLVKAFPTEIILDSIVSPSTIAKAHELLEAVVDSGTGKALRNPHYKIAGKTGTAQIQKPKFGYDKTHMTYQASFAGYFPADRPKYSCIAVVYAPSSGEYVGGAVSAPIFKEIADKVFSNEMDLHKELAAADTDAQKIPESKAGQQKDLNHVLAYLNVNALSRNADASWVSTAVSDAGVMMTERKTQYGAVPNVLGMGIRDAIYLLENSGLNVKVSGKGSVRKQSLDPGTKIQKGQKIVIELG